MIGGREQVEGRHVEWHIMAAKRGEFQGRWSIVSNETQTGGGGRGLSKRPFDLTKLSDSFS